ncbi:MAG TPA: sigma-54 dependent transcriptional regulator, partial [Acidobacteriota bacterium]|nr:sigma-54 dependent transcriptional regulator [Acidobacteriota bacterium]
MANILIIDDEESIRTTLSSYLQAKGHRVMEAELGATGLGICRRESPDLVLLDMKLPDGDGIELLQQIRSENEFTVVIMITAFGTIEKAVRTLKLGAENFLTKPFDPEALLIVMEHALRNLSLRKQEVLQELTRKSEDENHFIGRSSRMLKFYELARIVSQDQITILIQGETGSGKGRWAQWIHDNGPRPSKAFVELNCAGLSKELLESELFGYEKGAFTGAVSNKVGLLEVASGGTLFLDEISEMELPVQAKMLKVLEEKKFRRLGAVQERRSDVRLITATNRNLETFVKDGKFR